MKSIGNIKIVFLILALFILSSGCSTVRVPIEVIHPAEINMKKYKQIAIGEIDGNMGTPFSDGIKNNLVESERFKVIDRNRTKAIMKELNLSQSDLSDSNSRLKLGKMLSASALITGHTEGKYKENTTSKKGKCGSEKTGYYACTHYYREGVYSTSGSIDVVDVESGQIIRSKLLNAGYQKTTSATDKAPDSIDKDSLASSALSSNISAFLKSITPWAETVQVPFIKDGDIPDLERGINQAKMGDLDKAIEIFSNAARAAEGNGSIKAKKIAKAYFNLGLACNYSWDYDNAIVAFKKAFELNPDDYYIRWMKEAEKQKAERKKLEAQGAAGAGA